MVSFAEQGERSPSDELAMAFASALGFEQGFFYVSIAEPFLEAECNFRHRRTAPETLKKQVRAHACLLSMVLRELTTKFKFPRFNVPAIQASNDEEIEIAALECRSYWNVPVDRPILHIGRLLEHAGVVLIRHLTHTQRIDAFSRHGETSMIFLNLWKESTSRRFFDVAHETGHLVLHRGRSTGCEYTERQADHFAGAFLLPMGPFSRDFRSAPLSISHLLALKRKWFASVSAMITRARELQLIDLNAYRRLQKQIAVKWRGREPLEPDFNAGELFSTALTKFAMSDRNALARLSDRLQFGLSTLSEITGFDPPGSKIVHFR